MRRTRHDGILLAGRRGFSPAIIGGIVRTIAAVAGIVLYAAGISELAALPLTPFRYADQAQRYCPTDKVVWLDFRKGVYYARGQKLYGHGFDGSFVCLNEARSSGYRRSVLGLR